MINKHPEVSLEQPRSVRTQIAEQLREQIRSGKWEDGHRLPSTQALAAAWGTEATTVHRALAILVKEGLLTRVPKRGTFVRRREEKLTCVGIYDTAGNVRESQFEQALQAALKEELTATGIEMDVWLDPRPVAEQGQPWMPLVRAAEHREFQALIATSTDWPHLSWQQRLPVPTAFQTSANLPNEVGADYAQFAEVSVRALAQQGCRSVGLIFPHNPATAPTDPRPNLGGDFVEHFLGLAHDLGMTVRNRWMRLPSRDDALVGRSQESYGYECFREVWAQTERPEGLVVYPDTAARGVILAARERQVPVPAELKLVLHKNEAIDLFCPMPATFVVLSERAIARALLEQVQKQFRGESCQPVAVPFRLAAHRGNSQQSTTNPKGKGVRNANQSTTQDNRQRQS